MRPICMYESCDLLILKSLFLRVSLKQLGFASCSIKDKHSASGVIFHKDWVVHGKWVIASIASVCLSCPYPRQLSSKKMFKVMTLILNREMWFKLNHQPNSIFIMYFSLSQQTYNLGVQLTLQVKKSPSQPRLPCTNNCQLGMPFFFTSMLFCNFTSSKVTQDQNQQSVHPIRQFPHMQDSKGLHKPLGQRYSHQAHSFTLYWIVTTLQMEDNPRMAVYNCHHRIQETKTRLQSPRPIWATQQDSVSNHWELGMWLSGWVLT